jgi:DNA-directed RNA polymerase specialized sigma24 family protein
MIFGISLSNPSQSQLSSLDPFPVTQWTLIAWAGADGPMKRAAMAELLRRYLTPMKSHLVMRFRIPTEQAEDLLQGFLASQVLERNLIRRADRGKGKFRSFLLVALDRYARNQIRDGHAQKRSAARTCALETSAEPVSREPGPSDIFDVEWAREVVAEALRRMKRDCTSFNRPDIWGVFQQRILTPSFDDVSPPPYERLVEAFGFNSSSQASNVLITAKRMFARGLRSVVAEYEPEEARIDSEISELRQILSKAHP